MSESRSSGSEEEKPNNNTARTELLWTLRDTLEYLQSQKKVDLSSKIKESILRAWDSNDEKTLDEARRLLRNTLYTSSSFLDEAIQTLNEKLTDVIKNQETTSQDQDAKKAYEEIFNVPRDHKKNEEYWINARKYRTGCLSKLADLLESPYATARAISAREDLKKENQVTFPKQTELKEIFEDLDKQSTEHKYTIDPRIEQEFKSLGLELKKPSPSNKLKYVSLRYLAMEENQNKLMIFSQDNLTSGHSKNQDDIDTKRKNFLRICDEDFGKKIKDFLQKKEQEQKNEESPLSEDLVNTYFRKKLAEIPYAWNIVQSCSNIYTRFEKDKIVNADVKNLAVEIFQALDDSDQTKKIEELLKNYINKEYLFNDLLKQIRTLAQNVEEMRVNNRIQILWLPEQENLREEGRKNIQEKLGPLQSFLAGCQKDKKNINVKSSLIRNWSQEMTAMIHSYSTYIQLAEQAQTEDAATPAIFIQDKLKEKGEEKKRELNENLDPLASLGNFLNAISTLKSTYENHKKGLWLKRRQDIKPEKEKIIKQIENTLSIVGKQVASFLEKDYEGIISNKAFCLTTYKALLPALTSQKDEIKKIDKNSHLVKQLNGLITLGKETFEKIDPDAALQKKETSSHQSSFRSPSR